MIALIAAGQFPGFALAFYEPLLQAGHNQPAPSPLALVADDAILLAPRRVGDSWQGFLIAEHSAADQVRAFHSPEQADPVVWLAVSPPAAGAAAVWAEAAASLPIRQPPLGP